MGYDDVDPMVSKGTEREAERLNAALNRLGALEQELSSTKEVVILTFLNSVIEVYTRKRKIEIKTIINVTICIFFLCEWFSRLRRRKKKS